MSITLGLYDLFSYLIPGIVFLYTINEFLILFNWGYIEVGNLTNFTHLAIISVVAYITGHLFASVSHYVWFKRAYVGVPDKALGKIRQRSSGIEIGYEPNESAILLDVLRQRKGGALEDVERYKANSLMMRNISLAMVLFSILQLTSIFVKGFSIDVLVIGVLSIVLAGFAHRWGKRFDEWYYHSIFAQALSYGPNLKDFIANDKPCWKVNTSNNGKDIGEE